MQSKGIKILLLAVTFWLFTEACKSETRRTDKPLATSILCGADRVAEYHPLLKGKRVALAVNQTSMIGQTHLVDSLLQLGINIVTIFAPEHGFRGDHSAGEKVHDMTDSKTGLPIISLYGKNRKPSAEQIKDVDIIVFDIQDVGVRFYTYISTMHYLMEAAQENDKEMLVLDRPNPNGFFVDGPMRAKEFKSFIGMHPIPLVHGLTVGELALMINGEGWLNGGNTCSLKVISCSNYTHDSLYQLPVAPSPNLPNMASVYLYPTLGLFEGTHVSIGRGTPYPFQLLGKPEYNSSFSFKPVSIKGVAEKPKFENQLCKGVLLNSEVDQLIGNPGLRIAWLIEHYAMAKENQNTSDFFLASFNKLAGSEALKQQLIEGQSESEIKDSWRADLEEYNEMRRSYLLYPDFSKKNLDK